jgi:hypothetical protein
LKRTEYLRRKIALFWGKSLKKCGEFGRSSPNLLQRNMRARFSRTVSFLDEMHGGRAHPVAT